MYQFCIYVQFHLLQYFVHLIVLVYNYGTLLNAATEIMHMTRSLCSVLLNRLVFVIENISFCSAAGTKLSNNNSLKFTFRNFSGLNLCGIPLSYRFFM